MQERACLLRIAASTKTRPKQSSKASGSEWDKAQSDHSFIQWGSVNTNSPWITGAIRPMKPGTCSCLRLACLDLVMTLKGSSVRWAS